MKIKRFILSLSLVLISIGCFGQKAFEGVLTFNATKPSVKEKGTVIFYMKDGRTRMEVSSHSDALDAEFVLVLDEKGVDMVSEGTVTRVTDPKPYEGVPNARLLGRQEGVTANGFVTDKLTFDTGTGNIIYWLTDELPVSYEQLPQMMKNNMPRSANYGNGFPVKMEMADADGNIIRTQDLVSVKPTKVSDSRFERK